MANGIIDSLKDSVRYLPQRAIQGVIGENMGHKVEGWLGMPLGPDAQGNVYQEPGQIDPNYHRQMLEKANQGFRDQQAPRRGFPQR